MFDGGHECSVPALFWPDEHALRLKVWLKRTAGFPAMNSPPSPIFRCPWRTQPMG